MITGDYDKLKDLASRNMCPEHKCLLDVAWYGKEKTWVLRCGHGHYPNALTRQLSLTEEYRAGEELPSFIEDSIKRRERRKAMQQGKESTAVTFAGVPATDLATGELLAKDVVQALVNYADKYSLDPARGHVMVMYGKPYIGIDGYLFHAHRSKIPYSLTGRPMSRKELQERGYKPGDIGYIAFGKRLDTHQEFDGVGFVTKAETEAKAKGRPEQLRYPVVAEKPGQMVQKRAEWQCLRRMFPIGETEQD